MEGEDSDKMKQALEEVLSHFDIKLDHVEQSDEEKKAARHGNYAEIISKTGEKLDELSEKGQKILEDSGMTREELEAYASNHDNFTKEQWEALQNLRAATEDFKRRTQQIVGEENLKKATKTDKKQQHRRFGKKKHWTPL